MQTRLTLCLTYFLLTALLQVTPLRASSTKDFASERNSNECNAYLGKKTVNDQPTISDWKTIDKLTRPYLQITFLWENDSFTLRDVTDEHYTNGMKLSWINNPCHQEGKLSKRVIGQFVADNDYAIFTGNAIGMNMYTPKRITSTLRNPNDRPYVGWAYYSLNAQAIKKESPNQLSAHALELQIGISGPSSAQGRIQTWWHEDVVKSDQIPRGWENQTEDRIGVNLLWTSRWSIYNDPGWFRVTPHAGLSIGNVVNFFNLGAMVSFGNISDDYPNLSIQPSLIDATPLWMDDKKKNGTPQNGKKSTLYLFLGTDARHISSSIFVEGYGSVQHDIQLEKFVYDTMIGITWKPKSWKTKLSLMRIDRSREFSSLDKSKERGHSILQFSMTTNF